jgi:hypothetical protein
MTTEQYSMGSWDMGYDPCVVLLDNLDNVDKVTSEQYLMRS